MIKQFFFKQFNLAWVICLHSVLMSNGSFRPKDRTLSGATTPGLSGHGSDSKKEYSTCSKAPVLLEPHHQIVQCYIRKLVARLSYPLMWVSYPFCRDPVDVFYCPNRLSRKKRRKMNFLKSQHPTEFKWRKAKNTFEKALLFPIKLEKPELVLLVL